MRKITSVASLLIFFSMMIFVATKDNMSVKSQTEENPSYSQMDNEQVSIADKEDNVTSKDPLEDVTEETSTEDTMSEEVTEETTEETTEDITVQPPVEEDTSDEVTSETPSPEVPPVQEMPKEEPLITDSVVSLSGESNIYSFFQGPHAWWQDKPWSGEWGEYEFAGKIFGDFGCGMCCMANIYDTLSPYEVSPWDMFEYAQMVSSYAPSSAGAAISWSQMQSTLNTCGISSKLYCKPGSYEEFRQHVKSSQSVLVLVLVLVCSANDNTFWETTKGHYVTIWLYDEATDTVFLSDSGKIARNRQRIPLRYVYNALKTASDYQYMTINAYVEENNQWKANGITENWIRP